eukprot:2906282-Amphidinium_carterae.3
MAVNMGDGFRQYAEGVRCSSCRSQAMQAGPRGCMGKLTKYGVHDTLDEWHSVALALKFPMDQMRYARHWQVRTMKGLLESTPAEVVAKRSSMLQTLIDKMAELKYEEEKFRPGMPD